MTAITLLLFVGAAGKSAQIPLYVWLPDAMEGPTPVSSLIHAATMVTAGVYMIARCNVLYSMAPISMAIVAIVGVATAIYTASIGFCQNDIKKVLAYSTISQLGYMFLGVGVGAYSAGIFHLMTHAFFKGLLFLGAGSIMHALSGELDMRKMGGLRKKIPVTFWTFFIATLAIAGIPGSFRIFQQGRNPLAGLLQFSRPYPALARGCRGRRDDGLLYVQGPLYDLLGGVSCRRTCETPYPRISEDHDRALDGPCCRFRVGGYVGIPHRPGGSQPYP